MGYVVLVIATLVALYSIFARKAEAALASVFVLVAGFLLTMFLGAMSQPINDYPIKREMQAINTGTELSGSFFLGSGGFGEDAKYYFYAKDSRGLKLYTVDASNARIVEDATPGTAYAEQECEIYEEVTWIAPMHLDADVNCSTKYDAWTFHVPPGSVAYNIDLSLPGGK